MCVYEIKSVGLWIFLVVCNHINLPCVLQRVKTHFTGCLSPPLSLLLEKHPPQSTTTFAALQHCNSHFCCFFFFLSLHTVLLISHSPHLLQSLVMIAPILDQSLAVADVEKLAYTNLHIYVHILIKYTCNFNLIQPLH